MYKKMKILLFFLIFSIFGGNIYSEDSVADIRNIGSYSKNIYGTRAKGMGETFVALADDSSTLFINPAGLARLPWSYISLNFQYLPFNTLAGAVSFTKGIGENDIWTFGIGLTTFTSLNVPKYDASGNKTGNVSNFSNTLYISNAIKIGDSEALKIGFNLKVIGEFIENVSGYGGGLDLGIFSTISFIDLGLVLQDVFTAEALSGRANPLYFDRKLMLGVAFRGTDDAFAVSLQFNKNISNSTPINVSLGGYFRIWKKPNDLSFLDEKKDKSENTKPEDLKIKPEYTDEIYLMAGYGNNSFTAGITFKVFGIRLDYAAIFPTLFTDNISHSISLDFHF